MTDEAATRRVTERLAALREADGRLARALEATHAGLSTIPATAIDMEPAEAIPAAVAALREPLGIQALVATEDRSMRQKLDRSGYGPVPPSAKASDDLQTAYVAVGDVSPAVRQGVR